MAVDEVAKALEHATVKDAPSEALFWAYYAAVNEDPKIETFSAQALQRVMSELSQTFHPPWLFQGSLWRAWVIAHTVDDEAAELSLLASFDRKLLQFLAPARLTLTDTGVISGLSGILIYALERHRGGATGVSRSICELAFARIAQLAVETDEGVHWPTTDTPERLAEMPNGFTFCGPGHGVAGIIGVLSAVHRQKLADCDFLIRRGEQWLANQRTSAMPLWRDVHVVSPGIAPELSKWLSWCSGSLSTAIMRWQARNTLGLPVAEALAQIRACAMVEPADFPTNNAALCHGALGNAHLFHRCWDATGEELFRTAANRWLMEAFALRSYDPGRPGFITTFDGEPLPHDFLWGNAGIGLALMSLLGNEAPGWDRLLGLSVELARGDGC